MDKENGAVTLIEASIVFPIVFIVLFFIICLGNAYYIRSYMDNATAQYAVMAANYAANESICMTEDYPNYLGFYEIGKDVNPYQFKVSDTLKNYMNTLVSKEVNSEANTLLASLAPSDITPSNIGSEYVYFDESFFFPTVSVKVKYTVNVFPFVKSLGIASKEYESYAETGMTDNVEFIRNLDTVRDIFIDFTQSDTGGAIVSKVKGKIDEIIDKLNKFLKFFKKS